MEHRFARPGKANTPAAEKALGELCELIVSAYAFAAVKGNRTTMPRIKLKGFPFHLLKQDLFADADPVKGKSHLFVNSF